MSSIKLFYFTFSSLYIILRYHMCCRTSTNAVPWYICGQVIPFSRGSAWEQPPPDLASYLYKNRIVYLGMSLVPSVTELILAEFLYLQYEDADKPIYLYVNSTGTTKVNNSLFSLACFWSFPWIFFLSVHYGCMETILYKWIN